MFWLFANSSQLPRAYPLQRLTKRVSSSLPLFIWGDVTPSVTITYQARFRVPVADGADAIFRRVATRLLADPATLRGAMATS